MKAFELMAQYNKWMNEKIYTCAEKLSEDELAEDRGAFFGSVLGTLNHILVGDIIWLKRFSEHPKDFSSLIYLRNRAQPKSLAEVTHSDLSVLSSERKIIDEIIVSFSKEISQTDADSSLNYRNTKGEEFSKNFGHLLQHMFNHQTHHRGQVSTLFNQLGHDVGATDLLMCIPSDPRL
ncbi:DinB family protein [uncultured Microbulbifer sp.]|uniref:DinB family protein n=1 Tax=uncultured Microbulbifer sp. TaxID=348147 RepID=UPI00261435F4|nr:DinB family protein [uncultured Microbulbifer sp.]